MVGNPFHYGTPVKGQQFVGRESEVDAIVGRIRDHVNVVLLSPRRYGKTSILLRTERKLRPLKPALVHVNLFRSRDSATLAAALATAAFNIPGTRRRRGRRAVGEFVHRLRIRPTVTLGDDGRPQISLGPEIVGREMDAVLADTFDILTEQAEHRPAALILDEFQTVVDFDRGLPAVIKAMVDEHPTVSLVAAGSKQHLMERLFGERRAALFDTSERITLGPLPGDQMASFLRRRTAASGKKMDADTARLLVEMAGPVPDDIQHLAYEAFDLAQSESIGSEEVEKGVSRAVGRLESLYRDVYDLLSAGQRRVLDQLAQRPSSSPSSAEFVRRTGLANASSVKRALDALINAELVVLREGRRQVADPFLAAWLQKVGEQ